MRVLTAHGAAPLWRLASLASATLALASCARVPTQSASMQASPDLIVSANQLQLQAFEMGRTLSIIIEQAADSILEASTDPGIRRNALLWKISAIPLVQEAALRVDPQVAAVDLLAFTIQQSDYYRGPGRDTFGPQQPIAVAAAADAERAAMGLVSGSLERGRLSVAAEANLRQWAADHPMQGPALRRASVLSSDWKALGFSDNTLAATLGSVDRTLVNISYRLSYMNETLAEEARWNAELEATQVMRTPLVDSLLGASTATLRSVGTLADDLPTLLDGQREAVMREINQQRVLAFQEIAAQRQAIEAALSRERAALMEEVRQERIAAFLAADSLAQRSIDRTGAMLRQLILELTVGALIVVVALLVSGFVLVNRWRAKAA
jgi:hypothetical protein